MAGRSTPRESVVEDHLVEQCDRLGLLCLKFVSPSRRGVPDRMVLGRDAFGHSVTLFVELKRPGEIPRPDQRAMILTMREHGAHAIVADSTDAVDDLLSEYFTDPPVPILDRDPSSALLPGRVGATLTIGRGPTAATTPRPAAQPLAELPEKES